MLGWDHILRTTRWATMGLRGGSMVHKVRPQGRSVSTGCFTFLFFKNPKSIMDEFTVVSCSHTSFVDSPGKSNNIFFLKL